MRPLRPHARVRGAALALLLLIVPAGLVGGCGGNGTSGRLRSRLLSVSDLPASWSVATSSNSATLTSTPCLSGPARHREGWDYQRAGFVEGKSIPNVGEALAAGARVHQVWNGFARALAGCRSATLVLDGTKVKATIRPVAFPRIGRTSSAYQWAFTLGGIRIGFDLVLFQTAGYGGTLSYASLGRPRTSTVEAFARAAVAKAQYGRTAPVPDGVSIASALVKTARTRLGAVAYRQIGSGPPLLLITGFGGAMETWDPRLVDLLAQHHRVITFDNAGIGRTHSLPAPLTIDAMADQTSVLIDTLRIGRTDVLGWSMGSMIAQALAVRHPAQVRRLVLSASFPGNGTTTRPARSELDAFESGDPKQVMAALFPADQTPAQNAYLAATSSYPPAPSVPARVAAAQKNAIDAWWSGTDLAGAKSGAIRVPTLIADGTVDQLDPVANSHTLATLIHSARLKLYPDAGHAFLFQHQASFGPAIESFLASACPVTEPGGPRPPLRALLNFGERIGSASDPRLYGNGVLWTELPSPSSFSWNPHTRMIDLKLPWFRAGAGLVTITAKPASGHPGRFGAHVGTPQEYGATGFAASGLQFGRPGCWRLQARLAGRVLPLVLNVPSSARARVLRQTG